MNRMLCIGVLFFSVGVSADPRVHLDTGACHVPWDVNTDNEAKFGVCEASLNDDNGTIAAWARVEREWVPVSAVAPQIAPTPHNGNKVVCETTTIENIGTCDITDDDGNAYSTADWTSTTDVCSLKKQGGPGYSVTYTTECRNAAAE